MKFLNVSQEQNENLLNLWKRFKRLNGSDYEASFEKADFFKVIKTGNAFKVYYTCIPEMHRALLHIAQLIIEGADNEISETRYFDNAGAMLDMSRAGVMKVEMVKEYIEYMALLGLNSLMLYMEDTYTVKEYEYFGYMRGRYSKEELKEIDEYGQKYGVEVIPCIQTLGHLEQFIKWFQGKRLSDTDTTLLVGDDNVYTFIDTILRTVSECFKTRKVHIGMDEAWGLGGGNYLKKFGYKKPFEILCEHLNKVKEIADKYGLKPMMWGDMYFRLASKKGTYYDKEAVIPSFVYDNVPDGINIVYWDYYHEDVDEYKRMIKKHYDLTDEVSFTGGVWLWRGLVPEFNITFRTTIPALKACKDEGIKTVYAAAWGDDGCENDGRFGLVGTALYAENTYNYDFDMEKFNKRLDILFGVKAEDFIEMSDAHFPLEQQIIDVKSPLCLKQVIYSDIMCGLADSEMMDERIAPQFSKLSNKYGELSKEDSYYKKHYLWLSAITKAAANKTVIIQKLHKAYASKDKDTLREIKNVLLPEYEQNIIDVKNIHYELWNYTYKPFGFEVVDGRYGVQLSRIKSAGRRLDDYIEGKIAKLEELEEVRLPINDVGLTTLHSRIYTAVATKGY